VSNAQSGYIKSILESVFEHEYMGRGVLFEGHVVSSRYCDSKTEALKSLNLLDLDDTAIDDRSDVWNFNMLVSFR
jgi:hypothetical protein